MVSLALALATGEEGNEVSEDDEAKEEWPWGRRAVGEEEGDEVGEEVRSMMVCARGEEEAGGVGGVFAVGFKLISFFELRRALRF